MEALNDVAKANSEIQDDLSEITVNGRVIKDVELTGWGSKARLEIDPESLEIKKAERSLNKGDAALANYYLNFLNKQFKKMDQV